MVSMSDLKTVFRGSIRIDEPLAQYTSMKVGGPVDYYLEPADREDLVALVRFFRQHDFPSMVIGRGTNVLVSDEGFRGAAISVERILSDVRTEGDLVRAESGARLTKLADFCIQKKFFVLQHADLIDDHQTGVTGRIVGHFSDEFAEHLFRFRIFAVDDQIARVEHRLADDGRSLIRINGLARQFYKLRADRGDGD